VPASADPWLRRQHGALKLRGLAVSLAAARLGAMGAAGTQARDIDRTRSERCVSGLSALSMTRQFWEGKRSRGRSAEDSWDVVLQHLDLADAISGLLIRLRSSIQQATGHCGPTPPPTPTAR
jgi:hypothetical protein